MYQISVARKIKNIKLTASDWQLYSLVPGTEANRYRSYFQKTARELNKAFSTLVNQGLKKQQIESKMLDIMHEFFTHLPQTTDQDVSPYDVLTYLLDYIFSELDYDTSSENL